MSFDFFAGIAASGVALFPVALIAWLQWRRETPATDRDRLDSIHRRLAPWWLVISATLLLVGAVGALITRT
jgi:hypothetical protein